MRAFASRGAEPVAIQPTRPPRTSWWTVAESGDAFLDQAEAARRRMNCDQHIKRPDKTEPRRRGR